MYTIVFEHCPAAGMRNGDEASASIILASVALLVKILITLEPCGSFDLNILYLCILNIVQPLVCKLVTWLHLALSGRSSSFNEMFITLEPCGIFGIQMYFNIV